MIKSIQQTSSVKNSKVNVNIADFDIPEQTDLVDFLFVVDILWNYDMPNAWFQESSD